MYGIKKGYIDLDLIKHFSNFLHLSISLLVCKLIRDGTIGLYGCSSALSLLFDLEVEVCELEDGSF